MDRSRNEEGRVGTRTTKFLNLARGGWIVFKINLTRNVNNLKSIECNHNKQEQTRKSIAKTRDFILVRLSWPTSSPQTTCLRVSLTLILRTTKSKSYTPIDKPLPIVYTSLYREGLSPCRLHFVNYKPWMWSASDVLQWLIGYLYWFYLTGHMKVFIGKVRGKFSWHNSELLEVNNLE